MGLTAVTRTAALEPTWKDSTEPTADQTPWFFPPLSSTNRWGIFFFFHRPFHEAGTSSTYTIYFCTFY